MLHIRQGIIKMETSYSLQIIWDIIGTMRPIYIICRAGRFISADDVNYLGIADNVVSKDNLYCYCNGNPVNNL